MKKFQLIIILLFIINVFSFGQKNTFEDVVYSDFIKSKKKSEFFTILGDDGDSGFYVATDSKLGNVEKSKKSAFIYQMDDAFNIINEIIIPFEDKPQITIEFKTKVFLFFSVKNRKNKSIELYHQILDKKTGSI